MGQDAVQIGVMQPKDGIAGRYIVIAYVSAYPGAENRVSLAAIGA